MNKKNILIVSLAIAVGFAGGWWYATTAKVLHQHQLIKTTDEAGHVYWTCPMHPQVRQDHPGNCPICGMKLIERQDAPASAVPAAEPAERKVLYWYDPMQPTQHFDKPGKSPFMDMDLVPKYADAAAESTGDHQVQIDPRMAQNLGMRTAEVKSGTFWQRIDAVGSVAVDEHRIVVIEARAAGWVERLDVRAAGETVRRGQSLAGIYSPELLAAQQELALAQKLNDATLTDAAQQRLHLLGVNHTDPRAPRKRVTITAPQSGVVTELMVREGAQITPGVPLMKLADLSKVWVLVEIPENQVSWVTAGKPAEAVLKSYPGKIFEGTVDYVYPILDPQTRTLRARLSFANADGALKPGMFAQVTVYGGARQDVTLVPSEAVIRTGSRTVVLVAEDAGRYRPAEVTLGSERGNEMVVLAGLTPGQQVVVSGQFLIDSEASLLGAYQRLNGGYSDSTNADHVGHGSAP